MDDILIVENLIKHYPIRRGVFPTTVGYVRAVDGISFSIPKGKTLGLVGESGCGKTTTGRVILRLIPPTSGQVVFNGRDVFAMNEHDLRNVRREMQIIFQDPYGSLNPRMTVGAMLAEPILVHHVEPQNLNGYSPEALESVDTGGRRLISSNRRRAMQRVDELLHLVGLSPEHASRYPHEFSGGQRQRIGIARALTLNLLRELQKDFGITYLFIAHDLAVVNHISDRVAVMYLGEIVEEADTAEIFSNPLHPYTQALLSAIPEPVPKKKGHRVRLEGDVPTPIDPPAGCRFHTRCPIAIEECKLAKPPLVELIAGHRVACIRTDVSAGFKIKSDRLEAGERD